MDDEEREALEMTTDELLARGDRGVPVEVARSKPKTRNREDFAQRMHRVVAETTAKSEAEELPVLRIYSTVESRSRHVTRRTM